MQVNEYYIQAALEERHWWFRSLRSRVLLSVKRAIYKSGRHGCISIADVGCGTGRLLQELKSKLSVEIDFLGLDNSEHALAISSKKGLSVDQLDIAQLSEKYPCFFDIITCIDVLYHKDVQPSVAIGSLFGALKPGGYLIINTAALPSLYRTHDRNTHGARRFTKESLVKHLASKNLSIESIYYWNTVAAAALYISLVITRVLPPKTDDKFLERSSVSSTSSRVFNLLGQAILGFEELILMPLKLNKIGTSLFVVARKS